MTDRRPPLSALTPRERALVARLRTPVAVQRFLREFPYNWKETLRTFRGVVKHGSAHCLEAVLFAATVLEQHGYPPLVLDIESQDKLDHVVFLYRQDGRWGTVARSRDEGLHGRKPVFRTVRALVDSYMDPFVDGEGRVVGYGTADLDVIVRTNWRLGTTNLWSVEQALIHMPHHRVHMSERRYARTLRRFRAFKAAHPTPDSESWRAHLPDQARHWL
ncbi:MAG: hypothetical protein IT361_03490 [Gemmatimonadaceae bacterium]|nr:hypothetical protein [Gemmatimonadaceae bacterium]